LTDFWKILKYQRS